MRTWGMGATGIQKVELRDAATHSVMCSRAPTDRCPTPSVKSAQAEKPQSSAALRQSSQAGHESTGKGAATRDPGRVAGYLNPPVEVCILHKGLVESLACSICSPVLGRVS